MSKALRKYNYLKQFIPGGNGINDNWFVPVKEEEIAASEKRLGCKFPSQLRDFYLEIGTGCLRSPITPLPAYQFHGDNEILRPSIIADILLLRHDSGYISQDVLDVMEPGDLPFFHIGDSSSFLFMKPTSEAPNAVYSLYGNVVENEFNKFIWRLYYESPSYYGDLL